MAYVFNPFTGVLDAVTGIGDTVTSGTQGSVLFIGPSSTLAQNNANFFWDDTNKELRIGGGTTKDSKIALTTEAADQYGIYIDSSTTGSTSTLNFFHGIYADINIGASTQPLPTMYGIRIEQDGSRNISDTSVTTNWNNNGLALSMTAGGTFSSANTGIETVTGLNFILANAVAGSVTGPDYTATRKGVVAQVSTTRTYNNVAGNYLEFNYGNQISISGNTTLTNGILTKISYGNHISVTGTGPSGSVHYGVYISSVTGAATNWAFYSAATANSYFAGNVGINNTPTARLFVTETNSAASSAVVFQGFSDGGFVTKEVLRIDNEFGEKMVAMAGSNLAGIGDYGSLNLYGTATAAYDLYSFGDFTWVNNSGEGSGDLRMGNLRIYRNGAWYQGSFQIVLRSAVGAYTVPVNCRYSSETAFGNNSTNYNAQVTVTPWDAFLTGLLVQGTPGGYGGTYYEARNDSASLLWSIAAQGEVSFDADVVPSSANQLSRSGTALQFHDGTAARSLINKVRKNSAGTIFSRPQINFIEGTNVTLTVADDAINNEIDVTIAASGGGGSGNSVTTTCAFGGSFTDKAQTVVTGQAWVTTNSEIIAQVLTPSGTDPDEIRLLDFKPVISDLVAGTGFTVTLYSEPEAKGDYDVMCIGV